MKFLDNLLADLVGKATGSTLAGSAVRKVGGSNLLMLGAAGAAVAGVLAARASGQSQQGQPQFGQPQFGQPQHGQPQFGQPQFGQPQHGQPQFSQTQFGQPQFGQPQHGYQPPPPGYPVLPPPLPPLPLQPSLPVAQPAILPSQALVFAITRTLVAAALADGKFHERERALIQERLGEAGFTPEQTQQIHRDLTLPPTASELAALTSDPTERATLFRFAARIVLVDQNMGDFEKLWLDRLAAAFELAPEHRAALEREVFGAG
jgi:uncharacterized membrane protein YebE (DUF533 family)